MSNSDPFGDLEQLFEELTHIGRPDAHRPRVDVVEADETVHVFVDLPGRDADGIDVTIKEGRTLTVSAAGREKEQDGEYVTRERSDEPVQRSLRLPAAVDEDETDASYDDGVLTVTLPKLVESAEGTEIPVN